MIDCPLCGNGVLVIKQFNFEDGKSVLVFTSNEVLDVDDCKTVRKNLKSVFPGRKIIINECSELAIKDI